MKNIRFNPAFKQSGSVQNSELRPNVLKCSIPTQQIDIDSNTHFRYQVGIGSD